MCGYTCRMFGARYPDAECIEGYMWDLDSYEDGLLTSGGEIPCPSCQTAGWLDHALEELEHIIPFPTDNPMPAEIWERLVIQALDINGPKARAHISSLSPFDLLDSKGRIDSPEYPWEDAEEGDEDIIQRRWPWPIANMSQHDRLAMINPAAPTA